MKKILIITLLALLALQGIAQKSFEKGDVLLNTSFGFGSNYHNQSAFNPSFLASLDFGVHDYLSVGPYIGASFFNNQQKAVDFGGRMNFHWWQLLDDRIRADLKQDQLEIYWTVSFGYEFVLLNSTEGETNQGRLDLGATTGLRWYPNGNDRIAVFTELGYSPISFMLLGATFKLRDS